jgi:hypothetical protein
MFLWQLNRVNYGKLALGETPLCHGMSETDGEKLNFEYESRPEDD